MYASADPRATFAHSNSVAARLRRSAALLSPLELRVSSPSTHMEDPLRAIRANLPPTSQLPRVSYSIVVATAAAKSAGTDRHSPSFPAGSSRRFTFEDTFVGNLTRISLRHDPHEEPNAVWKPHRILVTDLSLRRTWTFLCPTWLSRDIGNYAELKPQPEVHAGTRASHNAARRLSLSRRRTTASLHSLFSPGSNDSDHETEPARNEAGTRRVCFQLLKFTQTFSHVYLLGSTPALGEWDPNRALRMSMHAAADGTWRGEWRLELHMDDDYQQLEYTYMIVTANHSLDQRRVFLPDHRRTLDFTSPDLHSRAAEGARIHVKDLFGNTNFGLPSSGATSSSSTSSRRPLSRLSLRSCKPEPTLVSQGPFRSSAPFRARPLSAPTDHAHRSFAAMLEGFPAARVSDATQHARLSEEYSVSSFSQRGAVSPRVSSHENSSFANSPRQSHHKHDHSSRLEWNQQLNVSDSHIIRSAEHLKRRQSEVMYLKERNNSDLTNGTLQSPISSPKSHEGTSPVSSDSLSESEHTSADSEEQHVEDEPPATPSKEIIAERDSLLKTIQTLRKQNEEEKQAHEALRKQTESTQQVHQQLTKLVCMLRDQLKQVRDTMNERTEDFAMQQAEVVRLMMDSQEAHSSVQEKLIADRDHMLARWEREFKLRRKLFNQVQELRGNIRVFCRVRPLKEPTLPDGERAPLAFGFPDADLGENGSVRLGTKTFEFDHVFQPQMSQEQVYEETSGVVASVMDGYNVCVFAYGQTGSGKTHTMNGPSEDRGVNFRALMDLFDIAGERSEHSEIRISVSMLEIYNESLRDLIPPDSVTNPPKLEIRRDPNATSATAVYVPNLTEVRVNSVEDVWQLMHRGAANRSKGCTNMNEHSSRSHLILRVNVSCEKYSDGFKSSGVLHLVDLAGSERIARSQATGDRLKEARHINKSLATLGNVFSALNNHSSHIPYRNSRLTYLLQDCLGGDSKTLMFVNVSADELDSDESLSSLQFAQRVARVELKTAHRHTERTGEAKALAALGAKENELQSLQASVSSLQRELRKKDEKAADQAQNIKSLGSELKLTSKALEDRKKLDEVSRAGTAKELREAKALQEKAESDARSAIQRARTATDIVISKDDEIRRLQEMVQSKERTIAQKDKAIAELSQVAEHTDHGPDKSATTMTSSRPMSAPAGGLTKEVHTPLPRLPRSASTFVARPKHVRFEDTKPESGPSTSSIPQKAGKRTPATPINGPRRVGSTSLPRGQTMHNGRFQRQSLARVPPTSSTAKRMSYGYGTRTETLTNTTETSSSTRPLRNARLPRARTTVTRPPQRVGQGARSTSSSANGRPPTAPPRRVGTIASGVGRVASGKVPPKPQNTS
ncbi:Kinesin-like protein KIN-14R [Gracilariopsis chorda]|uniref:Kinesin-like protein KIN-14R n=1 Tax=Gracilariopsis chorda TaxID=448386 RepID=A0A2V3IYN9_9FLOR|nr:Kinesin-like protein KIN-14R [Gracilariopsis chorda]|eukprot:PXF46250.1 Kinesin-like protein KIN-14R [Gracilariopsis chorda]